MTASRDPDRLIRAFLEEGIAELPDRTFDTVRAVIDRTQQRVGFDPRRTFRMPTLFRVAGAVALVAILVAGVSIVMRPTGLVGESHTPANSAAATSGASTTPPSSPISSPTFGAYVWPGPLAAGTYSTPFSWDIPFEVRFTVPAGWESRDIEIVRDPVVTLAFGIVGNTYADPCRGVLADPPTGESVDDLATALASMPGLDAREPRPAELAGYGGTVVEASVRKDIACAPARFLLWADPDGSHLPVPHYGPPTYGAERTNMEIRILDVYGTRLVVSQLWSDAATAADREELQHVVDSIVFGPPTQTMSIGSCKLTVTHHGKDLGAPPYQITLGPTVPDALNGPMPAPYPSTVPVDWLDWRGADWRMMGRDLPGGTVLIPPPGVASQGFSTRDASDGRQAGSFVFDAPGIWWVRITDNRRADGSGCLRQFPVEVLPMP